MNGPQEAMPSPHHLSTIQIKSKCHKAPISFELAPMALIVQDVERISKDCET
jgi:hypothetical protein